MRSRAAGLLLAASLLAPFSIAGAQTPLKDAYLKRFVGKPAPPLVLKDMKGVPVKLSDYRGRVVLLNFWYSSCFPCRMETPDLIALYEAYKERGLVVLGINTDPLIMPQDGGEMLRRFIDSYKIPYPVLVADRKVYDDYGRAPIAPITLLIDRQGSIARVFWGATRGPVFESSVRPYLEARAAATPGRVTPSVP
ncbi:MAG TPA: TlpA disulfide reductase family protein [Candidatus Dormibacteraeota bacterium]|nr:TlpA disulfide reductase family protein [Candidatus Dormibacteraeota bacterium]